jgi:hypothetical protein
MKKPGVEVGLFVARIDAIGHVICAGVDALQARPPSNGRSFEIDH